MIRVTLGAFEWGHMRRRELIVTLVGATMWPLRAPAKAPPKMARIGFLGLAPASAWSTEVDALRTGLRELGYVEGKTLSWISVGQRVSTKCPRSQTSSFA
jgi:hypothetical protein